MIWKIILATISLIFFLTLLVYAIRKRRKRKNKTKNWDEWENPKSLKKDANIDIVRDSVGIYRDEREDYPRRHIWGKEEEERPLEFDDRDGDRFSPLRRW